jgi:endoglucanase
MLLLSTTSIGSGKPWQAWQGFQGAFISKDGRVVDHSQSDLRTVSEGQAYALFFALAGQEQATFDRLLMWTQNNLAQGNLKQNLPAWHWGKISNQWGIIDTNSASDADLWMVYSLLEASRLWCNPKYAELARSLGEVVLNQETLEVEGLGLSLLPGRVGFVKDNNAIKLNPSYVPPFIMARLASAWPEDPRWAKLYLGSQRLLLESIRNGIYPDWVDATPGNVSIAEGEARADFDAIRSYLWLGMTHAQDPIAASMHAQVTPLLRTGQHMPLWLEPETGRYAENAGPPGFQVAMTPLLNNHKQQGLAQEWLQQYSPKNDKPSTWLEYGYYNSVLNLFATGFMEGRYRFGPQGQLLPQGKEIKPCE